MNPFWPPIRDDIINDLKFLDVKLNKSNIFDEITQVFDEFISETVKKLSEIKKNTLLLANRLIEELAEVQ